MTDDTTGCPVGAVCLSCGGTTGLRVRVSSGPSGDLCWTACERCAVGWVPLRFTADAGMRLIIEHREHLGFPPRTRTSAAAGQRHAMTLPDALRDPDRAIALLDRYYRGRRADGGPLYTGALFERLGDPSATPDVITAEDLVAVSMLSVQVPPRAALAVLEIERDRFTRLLADVPADADLVDADDSAIDHRSAAQHLWQDLVALPGIGSVIAGKILARKRPRLVPVVDSVVLRTLNHAGRGYWLDLRAHLRDHDRALHRLLSDALHTLGLHERISVIRAFDVIVWLTGKNHDPAPDVELFR